jgi:3-phosphoshikimate 1-carboxyvinyltransferase
VSQVRLGPGTVRGSVLAPPSKSYTHRELVASFFATGPSEILGPLDSEDTRATLGGLERMGARIRPRREAWRIEPPRHRAEGSHRPITIDCKKSGTTLRFLATVAATRGVRCTLTGSPQLARRPMEALWGFLESAGATVRRPRSGRSLPTSIEGPIRAPSGEIDASESSQFLSSLLLTLPALEGRTLIRQRGESVSEPYIDATLDVLGRRSVAWHRDRRRFSIEGPLEYRGGRYRIPGDASSAAYLWAAAAATRGSVRVRGVPPERPQADLRILEFLERMGATVDRGRSGFRVSGGKLRGITVELSDAPDLMPLLGMLAALATGRSRLRGARHARYKESDRRQATARLVRALGGRARLSAKGLVVEPGPVPAAARFPWSDDHRVVMSGAVAALRAGPSTLADARSVEKSYPNFWSDLRALGVNVSGTVP